jgi:hypothetical protein
MCPAESGCGGANRSSESRSNLPISTPASQFFSGIDLSQGTREGPRRPRELWELAKVSGDGPTKLDRYGAELILALAGSSADGSS